MTAPPASPAPASGSASGPPSASAARVRVARLARRSREVLVLCALVGAATGVVVAGFDRLVVDVLYPRVADAPLWLAALAPVGGLVLAALALRTVGGPGTGPATADEYLHAFHDRDHALGLRGLAARLVAAVATLGSGGPMGLEGPSLFAGASIGSLVHRRLPRALRVAEPRTLLVAGAAAGVAAIFKAPATGAVFALEVPYRDELARRLLLPSLVAAASGYLAFVAVNGTEPLFHVVGDPAFGLRDLGGALLVGVLCGLGARLFAAAIGLAKRWARRPAWQRLAVAGPSLVALVAIGHAVTGERLVLGSGYGVVAWLDQGHRGAWVLAALLVLRCLATSVTVAGGGVGGLFVPLVVAGALAGALAASAVGSADSGLFMVIGVAAFLGAGYRVPLAAVTFVAETTGRPGFVVPGLLAAVAAELVVGSASVTAYQRPLDGAPTVH